MDRQLRNDFPKVKAQVRPEALQGEATLAKLAQRQGMHASKFTPWRRQLFEDTGSVLDEGTPAFENTGRQRRNLHTKVGDLTKERGCLGAAPVARARRAQCSGRLGKLDDDHMLMRTARSVRIEPILRPQSGFGG
jgi:transposase-like protein